MQLLNISLFPAVLERGEKKKSEIVNVDWWTSGLTNARQNKTIFFLFILFVLFGGGGS
jgi:hypothetical protein